MEGETRPAPELLLAQL
ncbi:hypothetical protein NPIL_599401, partial [Nephila pilipes]